jgi:putative ABC transport system ATP-binding protein
MAEPIILLENVSKDYVSGAGVVRALKSVSLRIEAGEFVAIVGTSGSGKSTLMNILGCLDRPTHGKYTLGGVDVGARTQNGRAIVRNHLIGFIFQGFNLLSRTSASENVELPLSYRGVGAKERRARAERALREVGLGDRMDHAPNQLSGGQQQRVAIARALVTEPPLLLADEPTGNLDTRTSLEVLSLLQRLNRDRGITICLVTHEPDIAECADRIITVKDGIIVSDVRVAKRTSADAALKALPKPDASLASSGGSAAGIRAAPPLSHFAVVLTGFGALLGWFLGARYGEFALGRPTAWITAVFSITLAAFIGLRRARKEAPSELGFLRLLDMNVRATLCLVLMVGGYWLAFPPAMALRFLKMDAGQWATTTLTLLGAMAAAATLCAAVMWSLAKVRLPGRKLASASEG